MLAPGIPRSLRKPLLGQRRQRFWRQLLVSSLCLLLLYGPVNLAIAQLLWPQPDGILVLGGHPHREAVAARLALLHPHLHVWSSSGLGPELAYPIFHALSISRDRITLDYQAVDTVTNFTTLVKTFRQQHVHHLYLVTSDYHMARARAIATVILGSHRIAFTPVPVPSFTPPESPLRIGRDILRSLLWLTTGWSGANLRNV
ncbi:YdcF family protein [Leptolyngbya sp. CCNP1308]|uniref:YdcF family protein n=1 Tax=Leptolyngbya sp. CCNP1308 TaxID=3110255 RepID=UPI002B20555D|nr:YdcF family protein [Leptolyngbya sp. CCNP1308]MEA5452418.1 YdcF family protein [Leptolyngbya sp. CCNP1308]